MLTASLSLTLRFGGTRDVFRTPYYVINTAKLS
jgi:hypothetical protein